MSRFLLPHMNSPPLNGPWIHLYSCLFLSRHEWQYCTLGVIVSCLGEWLIAFLPFRLASHLAVKSNHWEEKFQVRFSSNPLSFISKWMVSSATGTYLQLQSEYKVNSNILYCFNSVLNSPDQHLEQRFRMTGTEVLWKENELQKALWIQ